MKTNVALRKTLLFVVVLFLAGSIQSLLAQNDPTKEILVYFSSGVERATRGQLTARPSSAVTKAVLARFNISGDKITSAFPDFNEADTLKTTSDGRAFGMPNMAKIFKVRVPDGIARQTIVDSLRKLPNVLFAELNEVPVPLGDPNDQYYGYQWGLKNVQNGVRQQADIKAPEAWDIYTGSSNNIIGIIDWGVDGTHPDLNGKVSGDAPGTVFHGTHVAGTAAAITNNTTGVAGVDHNARILSEKIENLDEAATYQKIVDAVNYSPNVNVLNNSWGYLNNHYSTTVRFAFAYAYKMNRVAVAAMDDHGQTGATYPAAYGQGIIAVGATDNSDVRASWSEPGSWIDVVAPGVNILSTYRNGVTFSDPNYEYLSGTSMAAPHVSGIASLLKGYNPNLYNDDIEHIIQLSADDKGDPGWDQYYGYGRVNARRALNLLRAPMQLVQASTAGGSDQGVGGEGWMTIYGAQAWGLADGNYYVKRHEVRTTVTFTSNSWRAVWGRGAATNGWANEGSVNFGLGWCDVVPGTVTSTSAQLRTYVYEVYNTLGQSLGWKPTSPSGATFAYTALAVPSTITANSTLDGSFTFDDNITVNGGVTLSITPGSVLSFAGGKSLTVNGVLSANGTSSQPITFTSASGSGAGSWGSIIFSGSGASGSTLNYCNIRYGTQIQAVSTSNITIQNCVIQEVQQGVRFTSSTGSATTNTLTSSTIYHGIIVENGSTVNCYQNVVTKQSPNLQSGAGILYVGSGGNLFQNDINGWNWGVGAIWGASPYFYDFNTYGGRGNRIRNCGYGVDVYHQSYPVIGYPAGSYQEHSIHDNTYNVALNIDNYTVSTLYAAHVYWGAQVPPAQCLIGNGSTIQTYGMNLSYDPWAGYPRMAGSDLAAIGTLSSSVVSGASTAASIAPTDPPQAQDPLFEGRLLRLQDRNKEAKDFFLSYLAKQPGEQEAYVALFDCANDETIAEITSFFTQLPKEAAKEHKLLLGYLYLRQGKSDLAKRVNDELIHGNPNAPVATRATLNNFYIVLHNDNDPTTAATILQGVVDNAKGASANEGAALELSLAQQALDVYQRVNHGQPSPGQQQPTAQRAPSAPTEAEIVANYPNPFNPSTVISYQLPLTSHVSLKIFDMLGREVATLVDGQMEAGYHTATFDARQATGGRASVLASGMYFARLSVTPTKGSSAEVPQGGTQADKMFVQTVKMLLTK